MDTTKSLSDALQAEDVRATYAQPSYGGGPYREGDPNYQPEPIQSPTDIINSFAAQSLEAGLNAVSPMAHGAGGAELPPNADRPALPPILLPQDSPISEVGTPAGGRH